MIYYNRKKALAELVFKVQYYTVCRPRNSRVIYQTNYNLRYEKRTCLYSRTFISGFESIAYQGTSMWNSIANHIKALDRLRLHWPKCNGL